MMPFATPSLGKDGAAAAIVAAKRALIWRGTDANQSSGNKLTFSSEAYDPHGMHNPASNPSRITPGFNGYGRFIGNASPINNPASILIATRKNNAGMAGQGHAYTRISGHAMVENVASAIVPFINTDYFELEYSVGSEPVATAQTNWFAFEEVETAERCAFVTRTGLAAQALATGGFQAVTFADPAVTAAADGTYDTGGYWASGQPTRFTIPVGGDGYYRVSCGGSYTTNDVNCVLGKNGSGNLFTGVQCGNGSDPSGSSGHFSVVSAPVYLVAGDFVDVKVEVATAGNLSASNGQWFCLEKIPPANAIAVIGTLAAKTIASGSGTVTFANSLLDTNGGAINIGASNTRITVPAGFTKARVQIGGGIANSAGKHQFESTRLNSGGVTQSRTGLPVAIAGNVTLWDICSGFGAWIDVVPGDYFNMLYYHENTRNYAAGVAPWMAVEFAP